jgi:hypothetical protein
MATDWKHPRPRSPDSVKRVRKKLASGEVRIYFYHRETGARLYCDPGTAEFAWELRKVRGVREPAPKPLERYVYFIEAPGSGLIKIGVADDVASRFRALQLQCADTLTLVGSLVCRERGALERRLHKQFAHLRSHGEWFRPGPDLVDFIGRVVLR